MTSLSIILIVSYLIHKSRGGMLRLDSLILSVPFSQYLEIGRRSLDLNGAPSQISPYRLDQY